MMFDFSDRFLVPVKVAASNRTQRRAHEICFNYCNFDFDALKEDIAINTLLPFCSSYKDKTTEIWCNCFFSQQEAYPWRKQEAATAYSLVVLLKQTQYAEKKFGTKANI